MHPASSFERGKDESGVYFNAVSAVINFNGVELIIAVSNEFDLRRVFQTLANVPIDESGIQRIRIHQR
jgi:hypothetical protein